MKYTKIIVLFLFCLANIKAEYWEGTIGESKIYLNLDCYENSCSSRYFYESTLQDIVMAEGNKTDKNHYNLQVVHSDKVEEEFVLVKKSDNLLIGNWKSKDKTLKVQLNRLTLSNDDAFDRYRIKFLKHKRYKVEKLKTKKELVWIEEEHAKTCFFRLGNGFTKSSKEHLNPILDKLQDEFSIETLSCSTPFYYGAGMEPIHVKNTYLTNNLIQVSFLVKYDCAAHPDFYNVHRLYDLHTGQEYNLTDIITIGNDPIKLRELAFKAKNVPLKAQDKVKENSYDAYDIEYWESAGWAYTKKGIRIYLQFSTPERVFRGDYYLIPFELLKPYKNPSFKYAFGN